MRCVSFRPRSLAALVPALLAAVALVPPAAPARLVPAEPEEANPFQSRLGKHRQQAVETEGGSRESEAAVARGLEWLARQQARDGHWPLDGAVPDKGTPNDVAGTALGLLPLLGAGHTHRADPQHLHDQAIGRGLRFLLRRQDPRKGECGDGMYAHGLATIALCEAYGLSGDPTLREPAQRAVKFIVDAQHPTNGGWRYLPGQEGDTSVTGFQLQALKAAHRAGLEVPDATLKKAIRYLDGVMNPADHGYGYTGPQSTPSMSAVGLLCRQDLQGWRLPRAELVDGINKHLMVQLPGAAKNAYYYYYATQAVFQAGGDNWTQWNRKMREKLLATQDGNQDAPTYGSWSSAGDPLSAAGGRLLHTSLNLLCLEVYYRYPRGADGRKAE